MVELLLPPSAPSVFARFGFRLRFALSALVDSSWIFCNCSPDAAAVEMAFHFRIELRLGLAGRYAPGNRPSAPGIAEVINPASAPCERSSSDSAADNAIPAQVVLDSGMIMVLSHLLNARRMHDGRPGRYHGISVIQHPAVPDAPQSVRALPAS
jgi:hypothetical protein